MLTSVHTVHCHLHKHTKHRTLTKKLASIRILAASFWGTSSEISNKSFNPNHESNSHQNDAFELLQQKKAQLQQTDVVCIHEMNIIFIIQKTLIRWKKKIKNYLVIYKPSWSLCCVMYHRLCNNYLSNCSLALSLQLGKLHYIFHLEQSSLWLNKTKMKSTRGDVNHQTKPWHSFFFLLL